MNLYTLDFETAYSKEYSLKRMSVEDYVTDSRFQIIGVGVKKNKEPAKWYSPSSGDYYDPLFFSALINQLNLPDSAVLCHNTMFDGLILQHHFNTIPKFYFDTRLMAMPIARPKTGSVSLKNLATALHIGSKGEEVHSFEGFWHNNFSKEELSAYGDYCINDVNLTFYIFTLLRHALPKKELLTIDKTLRMYLQPRLVIDEVKLAEFLNIIRETKKKQIEELPPGVEKADLMSNIKFAEVLRRFDIDPPIKISPVTGKKTFAFAKNDLEFRSLREHEDCRIRTIVEARLAHKSTIDETRAERLSMIARTHQRLRVPLLYYGAHTGRYAGIEKINLQNLRRGGVLRECLLAPEGYNLIAGDLSQIEARLTAWFCEEAKLINSFNKKEDVYATFASEIYQRPINKTDDPQQRFIGKTCILGLGYGMSWRKFLSYLRGMDINLDSDEARLIVNTYRNYYRNIPKMWSWLDNNLISAIAYGNSLNKHPIKVTQKYKLDLPTAPSLYYIDLHKSVNTEGKRVWKYVFANNSGRPLWGGKLLENIIQSLARIIIRDALLNVYKKYPVVMQVHDELVVCVPEDDKEADKYIYDCLVNVPDWAEGLPIEAEVHRGKSYGDCK